MTGQLVSDGRLVELARKVFGAVDRSWVERDDLWVRVQLRSTWPSGAPLNDFIVRGLGSMTEGAWLCAMLRVRADAERGGMIIVGGEL